MAEPVWGRAALFGDSGRYRYMLDIDLGRAMFGAGGTIAYIGVNPSTADEIVDDATTRIWTRAARDIGARRWLAVNICGLVSTDVSALGKAPDPFGPLNGAAIDEAFAAADILCPCWGSRLKMPPLVRGAAGALLRRIADSGKTCMCFGLTGDGQPRHPLYTAGKLLPYEARP